MDGILQQMIGLGSLVYEGKHWPKLEAREYHIECWGKGSIVTNTFKFLTSWRYKKVGSLDRAEDAF